VVATAHAELRIRQRKNTPQIAAGMT
jgi:hypothetical protein